MKRKMKSIFTIILAVALVIGVIPAAAMAEDEHTHDSSCGYREAAACTHGENHDEDCGYKAEQTEIPCDHEHDETCGYLTEGGCTHSCTDGTCSYQPAVEGTSCKHAEGIHDETCGYVKGSPCNYNGEAVALQRTPSIETLITGTECTVPSTTANTEDDLKTWIKDAWLLSINGFADALNKAYPGTTIAQLTIETQPTITDGPEAFIAAVDGTVDEVSGIAGRYLFEINLPNGIRIAKKGCTIEPKKYVAPIMIAPEITATGTTVSQNDSEVTVNQGNKVTLTASFATDAATHTLQWSEKSEGADKWNVISNATGSSIEITTDDSNVHKQYICTAIYEPGKQEYPSELVSILINPKTTIAAKGSNDAGTYELTASGHGFEAGTILTEKQYTITIEDVAYAVKAGLPNANNAEVKDVEVWNGGALRKSRPEYGGIKAGEILVINGSKYLASIGALVWMGGEKGRNIRFINEKWTWISDDKMYGLDNFKTLMDKAGEFIKIDGVVYQYGIGLTTQPNLHYI
ncbi:MAG: hypothetical protein EOM34_05455 [Clostridia bacterium]|nr:hypothetical protein [Lachnospiraceae bacterium]NCC00108.1 hypothetical protein [Clostridia bacterium]NCD01630.1 hypothetical protein [Clostridia bacterium]